MASFSLVPSVLLTLSLASGIHAARNEGGSRAVLLSNVKAITVRKGQKTSHRRVAAVDQLKCSGGNAKGLYEVDVMRCRNEQDDYDEDDIQWTCNASLPPEFKLGSTDVICEGYSSAKDPYVLKGSCGVEYRLMLTAIGEKKFPQRASSMYRETDEHWSRSSLLFWALVVCVVGLMVYRAVFGNGMPQTPGRELPRSPFGWTGAHDPSEPAAPPLPPDTPNTKKQIAAAQAKHTGSSWMPGFVTGALGGIAGGYFAGSRGANNGLRTPPATRSDFLNPNSNGEGSSKEKSKSGKKASSSETASATTTSRYEGTGFGTTAPKMREGEGEGRGRGEREREGGRGKAEGERIEKLKLKLC